MWRSTASMPGMRAVVVEAARPPRGVGERVEADEFAGDEERPRRAQCRIGKALERVGVVGGRELAPRAAKRRIRGEVDAPAQPDRPRPAVVLDGRQRLGRQRHDPRRAREVVVGVQRLEDRLDEREGVEVVDRRRVEARLAGRERLAHDLVHVRRREGGQRQERRGQRQHQRQHGTANAARRERRRRRAVRIPGGAAAGPFGRSRFSGGSRSAQPAARRCRLAPLQRRFDAALHGPFRRKQSALMYHHAPTPCHAACSNDSPPACSRRSTN